MERVKEESHEGKNDVEMAYKDVLEINVQLEARILELQDQICWLTPNTQTPASYRNRLGGRGTAAGSSGIGQSSIGSPLSPGFRDTPTSTPRGVTVHSANVDISRPAAVPEKPSSFIVGSPQSSGGSLGSEQSEVIRRALECSAGPINVERALSSAGSSASGLHHQPGAAARSGGRVQATSPVIGSATSAKEFLEVSGSFNGNHD